MNRTDKVAAVSDLHKMVESFKAAVLTNFKGLNVEQMTQLRRRLKEEKIAYKVVKNTLMKLACKGTDLEKLSHEFEGPTAVAIAYDDPIPLAKILTEFQKNQPALEIKACVIEGKVASPKEIKELASMPPREVILAELLGSIQSVGTQVAGTILSAIQQVVGVIQARADQLAEQEGKGR